MSTVHVIRKFPSSNATPEIDYGVFQYFNHRTRRAPTNLQRSKGSEELLRAFVVIARFLRHGLHAGTSKQNRGLHSAQIKLPREVDSMSRASIQRLFVTSLNFTLIGGKDHYFQLQGKAADRRGGNESKRREDESERRGDSTMGNL
jgi:hypothetical protein